MENSFPSKGKVFPRPSGRSRTPVFDGFATFRIIYVAILGFVLLYVFTVKGVERFFGDYFVDQLSKAVAVNTPQEPIPEQIEARVQTAVNQSFWTVWGGVRVGVFVMGADGHPLYAGGRLLPPPDSVDSEDLAAEAARLLPVSIDVSVSVPHNTLVSNAILVFYAAVMLVGLYFYNRAVARRGEALLADALTARDARAARAQEIEQELDRVRHRLSQVHLSEDAHTREIQALRDERGSLQEKIDALSHREAELLAQSSQPPELESEREALEELLDEAIGDLDQKNEEIRELQGKLKRAAKEPSGGKGRQADLLGRRLRTLYKDLEIDDRAIQDLVGLRDETMKLKAEESLKRLCEHTEAAGVRRKVGGLPPGLSIFELGFAGKGRIYYSQGSQRRFRILCVGAKNSQKTDLEYLSRLPSGT